MSMRLSFTRGAVWLAVAGVIAIHLVGCGGRGGDLQRIPSSATPTPQPTATPVSNNPPAPPGF